MSAMHSLSSPLDLLSALKIKGKKFDWAKKTGIESEAALKKQVARRKPKAKSESKEKA